MIRKNTHGIYESSLFSDMGVIHGYANRYFDRKQFLEVLGIKSSDLVVGQQVHGIQIAVVKDSDKEKVIEGFDGLISKNLSIGLGVTFADCVPILVIDPIVGIIGTAHAGWKGTLGGITRKLIRAMEKVGATAENVFVSIGPHIGMCCYNVDEGRAFAFQKQFGKNEKIATKIQDEWHVDIGYANYQILQDCGIVKEHIDAPPICTSCQVDEFHSFRKDQKDRFDVQLGIIAL